MLNLVPVTFALLTTAAQPPRYASQFIPAPLDPSRDHSSLALLQRADLDGDGIDELVSASGGGALFSGQPYFVRWSPQLGTLQGSYAISGLPAGYQTTNVAVFDSNADSAPDLFVEATDPGGGKRFVVMLNNGQGAFATVFDHPSTGTDSHLYVTTGDFDGNGHTDVMTKDVILLNQGPDAQGAPVFVAGPSVPAGFVSQNIAPLRVVVQVAADLNNDGMDDLIVGASESTIWYASGGGTFLPPVDMPTSGVFTAYQVVVTDLNGDPYPDIVYTIGSSIRILLSDGTGSGFEPFLQRQVTIISVSSPLIALDADSDGDKDILINDIWYRNPGNGVLQTAVPSGSYLPIVDLDHDGTPDEFWQGVSFYSLNEAGGNTPAVSLLKGTLTAPPPDRFKADLVADLNGDGFPDIISFENTSVFEDGIFLHLGTSPTATQAVATLISGPTYLDHAILATDLEPDGDLDLLVLNQPLNTSTNLRVVTLINDGQANFTPSFKSLFARTNNSIGWVFYDADSDGELEFVYALTGGDPVALRIEEITPRAGEAVLRNAMTIPNRRAGQMLFALGDFNGDGLTDATAMHTAHKDLYTAFASAPGVFSPTTLVGPLPGAVHLLTVKADTGSSDDLAVYQVGPLGIQVLHGEDGLALIDPLISIDSAHIGDETRDDTVRHRFDPADNRPDFLLIPFRGSAGSFSTLIQLGQPQAATRHLPSNLFYPDANADGFPELVNVDTSLAASSNGFIMYPSLTGPRACPPDINNDGLLDNGDITAFVLAFLAGDSAADMNSDGILDNGDITAFVTAFLAGCV